MKRLFALTIALLFCFLISPAYVGPEVMDIKVGEIIVTESPWIDVALYGVSPDNTATQNTTGMNAMFAAVADGSTIRFKAGTFLFDGPVLANGNHFLRIEGQGSGSIESGTILMIEGAGEAAVIFLELRDVIGMEISNIHFAGNDDQGSGRTQIGTYVTGGNSSAINFRQCSWRYFAVGLQVGNISATENNNARINTYDCTWNYNTIGYQQFWQNALVNAHYNPEYALGGKGIQLGNAASQSGGLYIFNGNWGYNTVADIYLGSPTGLFIFGGRSEHSKQFIAGAGLGTNIIHHGVTLHGLDIQAQSDSSVPFIDHESSGIHMYGGRFGSYGDNAAFIRSQSGNSKNTFVGVQFNSMADFSATITDLGGSYSLYGCTGWNGAAAKSLPDGERRPEILSSDDTSIDAREGNDWALAGTSPYTITTIDSGYYGQVLTFRCNDNNATIDANIGGGILLDNNADWTCTSWIGDVITLKRAGTFWYETSRIPGYSP